MRRAFELGDGAAYDVIPAEAFLVSKARYKSIAVPEPEEGKGESNQSGLKNSPPSMRIDTVNIQYAADSQAVGRLEKLEKGTSIGANFSNIISVLRAFVGG